MNYDFMKLLMNLSNITRFNQFSLINRQNVAEHSFYVCWWSLLIAFYEEDNHKVFYHHHCDYGLLIVKALLHDLDETVTGDILYPTKHEYGGGEIGKIIKKFIPELIEKGLKSLDNKFVEEKILEYWKDAKDNSIEGRIVSAADLLDCYFYSIKEVCTGNKNMIDIFVKAKKLLKKYKDFSFIKLILSHKGYKNKRR